MQKIAQGILLNLIIPNPNVTGYKSYLIPWGEVRIISINWLINADKKDIKRFKYPQKYNFAKNCFYESAQKHCLEDVSLLGLVVSADLRNKISHVR